MIVAWSTRAFIHESARTSGTDFQFQLVGGKTSRIEDVGSRISTDDANRVIVRKLSCQ